jgi:hypothetical protein
MMQVEGVAGLGVLRGKVRTGLAVRARVSAGRKVCAWLPLYDQP